ncbi:MAG: hypothetical protein ACE5Z5_08455 [Candidatus Bathyarchaeia archaeon]
MDRDSRGRKSKVRIIRSFLEEHGNRAFYSRQIYEALEDRGIKKPDVMTSICLLERKGLLYVRGYQAGERMTKQT